mgnify:FL=1
MTPVVETMLNQLGGANKIRVMTGATIAIDDNSTTLVFNRQVGRSGQKLTHLTVSYNAGLDLYDLKATKLNKRTYEFDTVKKLTGVYGDQIKEICQNITGLYFTL